MNTTLKNLLITSIFILPLQALSEETEEITVEEISCTTEKCPMKQLMGSMHEKMDNMMSEFNDIIETEKDVILKNRMRDMHNKMDRMQVEMQQMHDAMKNMHEEMQSDHKYSTSDSTKFEKAFELQTSIDQMQQQLKIMERMIDNENNTAMKKNMQEIHDDMNKMLLRMERMQNENINWKKSD